MQMSPETPAARVGVLCVALALAWVVGPASARAQRAPERASSDSRQAVDVILVLDNSGSMRGNDPDHAMRTLVVDFALSLAPGSRLGVVVFDASALLVEPLSFEVGPGSRARWRETMATVDYSGQWSNSPAGVERALYEFKQTGRDGIPKIVLLVTDGLVDTGDRARDLEKARWLKEELAADASRDGVRIYGIALAEVSDVELIQALAHRTGGEYWRVPGAADIAEALASLGRSPPPKRPDAAPPAGTPVAGPTVASRAVAPAATAPEQPLSSAPVSTRGVLLLGLGLCVAAIVLVAPLLRRRLRARVRPSAYAPFASPGAAPLLPALPRGGRPPIVQLEDIADATGRGSPILLLDAPITRIGRDPGNDVVIPHDTVSSFHATLDHRDGYFHVEDQRSTNGTWLSGRRLFANRPARLKSGDVIDVAGHAFRFLIPDHEPLGRTQVLDVTSLAGARSAAPAPRAAASSAGSPGPLVTAFDQCLGGHLARIAAIGDAHRRFVERAFPIETRALLVRRGQDLIERCQREGQGGQTDLAKADIHYSICAIPLPLDRARDWYIEQHGGFAKFLVGLLDSWTGSTRRCDAICVITFGMLADAWLSVTIVPARSDADAIEVMSLEFLTEDERREANSLDIVDAGSLA